MSPFLITKQSRGTVVAFISAGFTLSSQRLLKESTIGRMKDSLTIVTYGYTMHVPKGLCLVIVLSLMLIYSSQDVMKL